MVEHRLSPLVCAIALAGCSGNDGDANEQMQMLTPCYEWQRFMRHPGHDMTEVASSGTGEYDFSKVGFVHAGSWELNFQAQANGTTDILQILLCVDGTIPFATCFDEDTSNDQGCANPIDVRCRGDEHRVGSVVDGMHGALKAEVLGITPDPPTDEPMQMATVRVRLMDANGAPVSDAQISRAQCSGSAGDFGHEGH